MGKDFPSVAARLAEGLNFPEVKTKLIWRKQT